MTIDPSFLSPLPAFRRTKRFGALLLALSILPTIGSLASPPDLTAGGTVPQEANQFWTLGATGARGWIYSDKLVTSDARQIAIVEVAEGSPADGVLQPGDVILGASGWPFTSDPRTEFGQALTAAEDQDGALKLTRWRDGESEEVVIQMVPLGSYSATAPFDCPKSSRILELGCEALAERMEEDNYPRSQNPITRSLNALALLASGDRSYLPLIRREVDWAAGYSAGSFQTWWYAYVIMLLAEYQVATGDDRGMDGMERLALEAANGQSIVGSWGHRFAGADGRLVGYGMMNAPGVPLTSALLMAREAGLDDPAIDRAIERSARLIRFYIGKGAVPYGDHAPWTQTHEDNGKCGMAAFMFHLLGEADGVDFFTRMSVASHGPERDTGHTGNFTNLTWAMPAIALAGPHATGAWMKEYGGWYFDLARTWDHRFPHQGPPKLKRDSYGGWDATGAFLLAYAMPERQILLTGKLLKGKRSELVPPLNPAEAQSLINAGRGWSNKDRTSAYDQLTEEELLGLITSWSPTVRERAAEALHRRGRGTAAEALTAMLDSDDLNTLYGGCEGLKRAGDRAADSVPQLTGLLDHGDLWVRIKAAEALAGIGQAAMSTAPTLLERLTVGPTPEDPRAMEQRYLTTILFDRRRGMLKNSLDAVDRDLLMSAVVAGLQNEDGRARGQFATVYQQLSFDEIKPLLPAVFEAVVNPAPSGIMFADGIRMAGLELLASHHIEGGMQACADYIRSQNKWGSEKRLVKQLEILKRYGRHAQSVIPHLNETADTWEQKGEENYPGRLTTQKVDRIREAVADIQAMDEGPSLIQLDLQASEALSTGSRSADGIAPNRFERAVAP